MGVRILHDRKDRQAAFYCSTSGFAFGPVFADDDDHDADERIESFSRWLKRDPRELNDAEMETAYGTWLGQEAAQWAAEEAEAKAVSAAEEAALDAEEAEWARRAAARKAAV